MAPLNSKDSKNFLENSASLLNFIEQIQANRKKHLIPIVA